MAHRWRDAQGRFISTPLEHKLRHDKTGYPLDDYGRRVSPKVTREPIRRAPPKVREIPVTRIGLTDVTWKTAAHLELEEHRYKNFSHMNRQEPTEIKEVFDAAIARHIQKGGFAPDEVTLYDYGILMRPEGRIAETLLLSIREKLAGTGASVTIIEEGPNQDAALLRFGDSKIGLSVDTVARSLEAFKDAVTKIYAEFVDWYDDYPDWSVFWDTDEELY